MFWFLVLSHFFRDGMGPFNNLTVVSKVGLEPFNRYCTEIIIACVAKFCGRLSNTLAMSNEQRTFTKLSLMPDTRSSIPNFMLVDKSAQWSPLGSLLHVYVNFSDTLLCWI